ncbi:MAG TPA: pyridoxal 5'-phosphate synthase glutaminase subunit PdxT [Acidimicrobiales bacterium]|nr:pyridoxal 5'-phosphate synthase glutaminase subunit PdxT [Acidimicrobiales bacterium]
MEVGVLALQGDVAEHRRALSDLGVGARDLRGPNDLCSLDGVVLPGGESTTVSLLLSSSGLLEPLGKEIAAGLPVLGTCAGMILLAGTVVGGRDDQRCYGAIDIRVRRNAYGRQLASFECDLAVPALGPEPLHAVFIRAPVVEAAGPEVEVLSTVTAPEGGDGEGVFAPGLGDLDRARATPALCRQGPVLVSSFHPELTEDRRVHRLFVATIEERGR